MSIDIDAFEEDRIKLSQKWSQYPNILWHGSKGIQMADHSLVHTQNLLGLADNLLTLLSEQKIDQKKTIKPIEFLILYYALWLHDIGHRGNKNYQEPIDVRDFHGVISGFLLLEDAFKNESKLYELNKSIAFPVALISMYHQRNLPFNEIDREYLVDEIAKIFPKELDPDSQLMEEITFLFSNCPDEVPNEYILLLSELKKIIINIISNSEAEAKEILSNVDLDFLTALLRFIDTVDFRCNRIGTKEESLSRRQCIKKETAFYENQEKFIFESLESTKLTGTTKKFCKKLLKELQKNKNIMLKNLDKRMKNTFDRVKNMKPGKLRTKDEVRKAQETFLNWRKWIRYLAFLRDQITYYYPLHRSILNVYFAPSNSGDGFLDIIFDVEPESTNSEEKAKAFEKCCKRIKKQINDEWNVGKGNNEISVGETLENRGIKIQKYIFIDISSSELKRKYYSFPDGRPLDC